VNAVFGISELAGRLGVSVPRLRRKLDDAERRGLFVAHRFGIHRCFGQDDVEAVRVVLAHLKTTPAGAARHV
jgi:hypothetical protein